MADYFEKVQWTVSFAELAPTGSDTLGTTLPINTATFSELELRSALKELAVDKAPPWPPPPQQLDLGGARASASGAALARASFS